MSRAGGKGRRGGGWIGDWALAGMFACVPAIAFAQTVGTEDAAASGPAVDARADATVDADAARVAAGQTKSRAAESPAAEAKTTQPPAPKPTAVEPATGTPPRAEPTTSEPATAEPPAADPPAANPPATNPAAANPAAANPAAANPAAASPAAASLPTASPAAAKPPTPVPPTADPAPATASATPPAGAASPSVDTGGAPPPSPEPAQTPVLPSPAAIAPQVPAATEALPPSSRAKVSTLAPAPAADDTASGEGAKAEASPQPPEPIGPPDLLSAGTPGSPDFIGPPLMPNFSILGQEVLPGAKARLEWSASQSFAGSEVISPVVVLHGVRPGPVLCLTGAIHGDELNGVEIIRRVTRNVDPQTLSGTIIAVPIVNLFGFSRSSRYLPDRRDLNRYFPGSERGSIASRIAHSFFHNVVRHCESLVDFHTGSFDRSNLPQVRADLRLPEVLRFARGFGAVPVLHSDGNKGMLRVAASVANIPSVTFEVGSPAVLEPVEIRAGERAMQALLHYLGMTAVTPGEQEPQAIFYDSVWVRANAGGMLIGAVELGQRVVPEQVLGTVVDPINDIEREIRSPLYGRVIGMARNQVVLPGFAAYHLGEETSEERAVREAAAGKVDDPVGEDPEPAPVDEDVEAMEPRED